ncbi:hypothetical protein RhiirB3_449833 [Rhizophagus irregularis]|nr:hypothetical protein RhiirB3_449833 [Rhizophagus irregularis]
MALYTLMELLDFLIKNGISSSYNHAILKELLKQYKDKISIENNHDFLPKKLKISITGSLATYSDIHFLLYEFHIIQCWENKMKQVLGSHEEKPHYLICFGDNLQYQVFSAQSPFDASVELHKIITPDRRTAVSGVHLFGLQLKCINRNRKGRPRELKLHKESSKTTQIKRAKGLAKKEQVHFENTIKDFYNPKDRVVLKAIDFTVENKEYHVTFGDENYVKKKQKLQSIAYVQDVENIPRDAYRHLAAVESILPREYAISQTRQEINAYMEELIPINFIDLNSTIMQEGFSEEPDITDPLIIEQVINATGKGAYRSVKKILEYIIPSYVEKGILDPAIPTIYLRISGDGQNVGKSENYPTLKVAANALTQELQELSNVGIVINNTLWNFEFFFSSDWKFLATCLGFNAANSNNFCPWCEITKNQHGNGQNNDWIISKSMSSLNKNPTAYPGHKLPSLFNMISLKNHVPDKLHIMLRITDCLWELVLQEIKNERLFNDITQNIIIKEMENLKIRFEFWNIHERAVLIKNLWDGFAELYDLLGEKKTDTQYFRLKAKAWYKLFLKKMKTLKNGGKFQNKTLAICEILEYEN